MQLKKPPFVPDTFNYPLNKTFSPSSFSIILANLPILPVFGIIIVVMSIPIVMKVAIVIWYSIW